MTGSVFTGNPPLAFQMSKIIIQGDMKLEKASSRNHFPAKCMECAKSSKPFIHGRCNFCQDSNFQEEVLCNLNRSTQNPTCFECHAFQPLLKLATSPGQGTRHEPKDQSAEISIEKLLHSDKVKYKRALVQQKLYRDPDLVMIEIKYHFAWNVIGRRPVFEESEPMIDFISNTIRNCSESVGGFASLLWLAPDHIHLYMESDGELSLDDIAQKLKRLSEAPILERFPNIIASQEVVTGLWDDAYFVEAIG